jgi:hypothetical protein
MLSKVFLFVLGLVLPLLSWIGLFELQSMGLVSKEDAHNLVILFVSAPGIFISLACLSGGVLFRSRFRIVSIFSLGFGAGLAAIILMLNFFDA